MERQGNETGLTAFAVALMFVYLLLVVARGESQEGVSSGNRLERLDVVTRIALSKPRTD